MDKSDLNRRVRANLIRLRLKTTLTQDFLARRSGVAHVAQIESGAKTAGKQALTKLAKALGVDVFEFFLPEDVRLVKDSTEKLFLELYSSLSQDARKVVMDFMVGFIKYENKRSFFDKDINDRLKNRHHIKI